MDVSGFLPVLQRQRLIVDYTFVSAVALFIYDYVLTLHLEIKFIWFSPWTYTKVLFLLIRYMACVDVFLLVIGQTFENVSAETCKITYPIATWVVVLQIFLAEGVLSIRTWAVWRTGKVIGIGLAALAVAHLVSQCILVNRFVHSLVFDSPPYPGFRGCFITSAATDLWENYVIITAVEAIVFVLMVISAFRAYQRGSKSELLRVIHRDGILFYIYLLAFTIGNMTVTIALPFDTMDMLSPLQVILYSVLTSRIVLGIREVSSGSLQTELHNTHVEPIEFATPLQARVFDEDHQDHTGFESVDMTV